MVVGVGEAGRGICVGIDVGKGCVGVGWWGRGVVCQWFVGAKWVW